MYHILPKKVCFVFVVGQSSQLPEQKEGLFFVAVARKFHGWFKKVSSTSLRSFLAVSSNGVSRVF